MDWLVCEVMSAIGRKRPRYSFVANLDEGLRGGTSCRRCRLGGTDQARTALSHWSQLLFSQVTPSSSGTLQGVRAEAISSAATSIKIFLLEVRNLCELRQRPRLGIDVGTVIQRTCS